MLLWWFSRNTALIETVAKQVLKAINAIRRKPADDGTEKLKATIRQLTSVRLSPLRMVIVFAWSFINWVTDVICLYAAMRAVGAEDVTVSTVLMAFVFSKVAGFIQATPGGVGPVEAVLTGTLIASGMVGTDAVATVLIYRLVSFILPAVVGWIVYLVGYGGNRRKDVEADAGAEGAESAESAERPANTEGADVDGTNARTDGREYVPDNIPTPTRPLADPQTETQEHQCPSPARSSWTSSPSSPSPCSPDWRTTRSPTRSR